MNARKAARTIPATVSRLLKSNAFLKAPPPSLAPMLAHPPPPSLVRTLPKRTPQDLPRSAATTASSSSNGSGSDYSTAKAKLDAGKALTRDDQLALHSPIPPNPTNRAPPRPPNTKHAKPLPIVFPEDEIRRQFFRDHPFEAYRPKDLNELERVRGVEQGPTGTEWTELRQRTIVPTAEDAIAFTLNLQEAHSVPLATAYKHALAQFRTLRAEHETAVYAASCEARAHGAVFFSEVERGLVAEERALDEWRHAKEVQDEINARQKGGARGTTMMPSSQAAMGSTSEGMWAREQEAAKVEEEQQAQYELTGGENYLQRFENRYLSRTAEQEAPSGAASGAEQSAST